MSPYFSSIAARGFVRASLLCLAMFGVAGCGDDDDAPSLDGGRDAGGGDAGNVCATAADCDDGVFCNGVERCEPAAAGASVEGCVAATDPVCPTDATCNETLDACQTPCDSPIDEDGDGYGSTACVGGNDCDDADANRFPTNPELCDLAGHDEDCNDTTFGDRDVDGDGFVSSVCCNGARCGDDCNDTDRLAAPGGRETCNRIDDDCDGAVDEGVTVDLYADLDGDLHGDSSASVRGCPGDGQTSPVGDDCDDTEPSIHGAQPEFCNGRDDDCDGAIDEGAGALTWYRDADGDGFGDPSGMTRSSCTFPSGYSLLPIDCDDSTRSVNPAAREICNGVDDDCNGTPDFVAGPGDGEDDDGDGVPDATCAPSGVLGDCDDGDPSTGVGAPEIDDDGLDNDCDGTIDEAGGTASWYVDADGDGYGTGTATRSSTPIEGSVTRDGDCADDDAARSPGAPELCNGIDDDCDGTVDGGLAARRCFFSEGFGVCGAVGPGIGCVLGVCGAGRDDCNDDASDGCEIDLRADAEHCGTCSAACAFGPSSFAECSDATCALRCIGSNANCNGIASDGCERNLATDVDACGMCTTVCPARANATRTCATSACSFTCLAGFGDCDGNIANGCETNLARSTASCGACGTTCDASLPVCAARVCTAVPFPSDGTEGALDVMVDTVLAPGAYHYTTIRVRAGATLTTNGSGVLELYASGDVTIDGTVDVSGGDGGVGYSLTISHSGGGGGATGNPLADGRSPTDLSMCSAAGGGGTGAVGMQGADNAAACGLGGNRGGGAGTGGSAAGGGGGGYAGGGGGASYQFDVGGRGASSAGGTGGAGGFGGTGIPCSGGGGGAGGAGYAGSIAAPMCGGGGGGGAIGADAEVDLAVVTTFRPGSAGGGGGGNYVLPSGGGGGGGGALRIASATRITLSASGEVRANGGNGGDGNAAQRNAGGGGGSGGVVFLSAPSVRNDGSVSAVGGVGGSALGARGGNGGLGRVRISALAAECTGSGAFAPTLVGTTCAPVAATAQRTYVAAWPN